MVKRAVFVLTLLAAAAAVVVPPWLALQESERQAYQTESDFALGYARDIQRRIEETGRQASRGIDLLSRSGFPPCSPEQIALMRQIDVSSTYLQAVGYVRGDMLVCSSIGDYTKSLGTQRFRTSRDAVVYTSIPSGGQIPNRLIGVRRGDFIALIHRDLPLDTWTSVPGVALAVVHLEAPRDAGPLAQRGSVDPRWLQRLGKLDQTTFVADGYLVAVVRSKELLTASIAAVPMAEVKKRTEGIAKRLVPAGLLAGLAIAASILMLARRQMSMANSLKQALRRHEFFLLYQPIVELGTGRWVGVEALLRWRRSTGELIGPDLFIPIAEQSGMIARLTEHVLHLVQHDAGDFLAAHPDFHIALNLSAPELESNAIVGLLDSLLVKTGAKPSTLIVEITERAFLNLASARQVIKEIRALGVEVAIDDFGTGYSSLSYLESLDLDYLKIDRSFIDAIGTRAPTNQVVSHIIAMAHTLGLRMVAEGVETEAQAEFLAKNGVQHVQGWMFGRPMPFDEVRAAYAANTTLPHANGT